MAGRPYTLLDVFTAEPLTGNPLAVVHDADGLDDEVMHRFARETRLSETSFVQSPRRQGADYRHRIWTVAREITLAGHPSLGTAVAVARARGQASANYVQETLAGLQPIDVELGEDVARASMLQEPVAYGPEVDPEDALAAVGLPADAAHPELEPRYVSTGAWQLLVPVADPDALSRVRPDRERIGALLHPQEAVVLYLAWVHPATGEARARSFSDGLADLEDPATGAGAGPLCAYAADRLGAEALTVAQGVEMGRPSRLEAQMEGDRVRVGGEVVVLIEGTVSL